MDSFKLFCLQERRDLTAAVEFYCGRSHEGAAHSALADAKASLEVLQGQVGHWLQLPLSCYHLSLSNVTIGPGGRGSGWSCAI